MSLSPAQERVMAWQVVNAASRDWPDEGMSTEHAIALYRDRYGVDLTDEWRAHHVHEHERTWRFRWLVIKAVVRRWFRKIKREWAGTRRTKRGG